MNIRIYQINKERDTQNALFMPYDAGRPIDPACYDRVFEGDVDCEDLEDVFTRFNTDGHPLHRGRSMSMSDVVEKADDGTFHYCDHFGFKDIAFDPSQAHTEDDLLKVVVVEPGREPYVSEMRQGLKPAQDVVGGYIEHVYNGDGTITVCNEEVKLVGLPGNRRIDGDVLVGTFFVVGDSGYGDYRSLTDEECDRYMERFAEPEEISQEEIDENTGFAVMPFDTFNPFEPS